LFCFFFFNDTATTEIYTLSLHDALPICIPLEENPALAEALAHVELEHAIPEALYRAVAEVLAFILRTSEKRA